MERWTAVDDFFADALIGPDEALEAALAASAAAGLPAINVSPLQGKLLHLLASTAGARRILEVGTLGGYSAIWLARALPEDGRLVTLELDPDYAEVARRNLAHAGMTERVEIRIGPAIESLPLLEGPFDLVFIDADKPSNPAYFDWAVKLTRPGGLVIVDNVVRAGAVADPDGDASVQGVRRLAAMVSAHPRVSATAIQTVGAKGWDGFLMAQVVTET